MKLSEFRKALDQAEVEALELMLDDPEVCAGEVTGPERVVDVETCSTLEVDGLPDWIIVIIKERKP